MATNDIVQGLTQLSRWIGDRNVSRDPKAATWARLVDLLLRRIVEPQRPVHRTTLSPRLIVRSTTAPPPLA